MSFTDFLDALDDSVFEEEPADLETFLYDKRFMGMPKLSPIQEEIVDRGSQVYKRDALAKLFGKEEAEEIWRKTTRDLLLVLGKGSGKDMCSQLICAYAVHKLLCLKDPAGYFNKPAGDAIDIVNMAINAQQAKRVFFDGLVTRIKRAPWFQGKYSARMNDIAFDKNITIYSLHSSYEAAEGLNIMIAVLDEIDGFEVEGQADAIYKALSGTVSSRFSDMGKVIRLSFPRKRDGHVMTAYNDAVLGSDVEEFSHTFKLNEELEDGAEGNEFTVHWSEETNLRYKYDNFYAIKAPTFRVNPTKHISDYKMDFYSDEVDTLMRVCAMPPDSDNNAFFKNHEKLRRIFSKENGYKGDINIKPEADTTYYIHIDLSKVHDRTVVAMGHVKEWVQVDMGGISTDPKPHIIIDLFRMWEPTKDNTVNHTEVMEFVLDLCRKFKVDLVTFDQWGSANLIEYLTSVGIRAEKQSLGREEYQEFGLVVGDERLEGPADDRLMDELTHLVILPNGKVDHPKKNYNDTAEAVCGVIRNCVENESQDSQVRVVTLETLAKDRLREREVNARLEQQPMPQDIANWLKGIQAI